MIDTCSFIGALALSVPAASFLALAVASLAKTAPPPGDARRPRMAVLVPAHNESESILPTLACLRAQIAAGDRLIVIADNCSDDTAAVAARAGAQVLVRADLARRGKGYALAHGVDALRSDAPEVVMVVDADCIVSGNALDIAGRACLASGRPVQLLNVMQAPPGATTRHRLLEFAFLVKNHVRAMGASRIGGACHLMGTGMALPWSLMSTAELATGHVAEDMRLGTDLAVAGHTTLLVPQASVRSQFPVQASDAHVQKSRWEHGHIATLRDQLPRLLSASLKRRSMGLLVLALDLCIPPLALYVLSLGGALMLTVLGALFLPELWGAAAVLGMAVGAVMLAVILSWHRFARQLLSPRELLSTVAYVIWKAPIYLAYFANRRTGWIRAKRDGR
jgi:cellulose synthase/poly-beta-1,6-N-acetylglucosamine synthase-like glycosyltransferase